MQQYAINNKLTPFVSMQNLYNAIHREEEREMMPTLQHFGVASIPCELSALCWKNSMLNPVKGHRWQEVT